MMLEANLLIATPEKTKAMLRAAPELFDNVKLIVIDEGHLLGGNRRNVKNELFFEHLRLLSRKRGARILVLSAVLPNAALLAQWIGGTRGALAESNWKPSDERFGILRWSKSGVRIDWHGESSCFNPHFVEFTKVVETGKKKGRKFPKNKTEAVAATAVRLSKIGPALIFVSQAQWVPSMAKAVILALAPADSDYIWPDTEWNLFEATCREELGAECTELIAARFGIVCHSNRLPPQVRIALEKLMAAKSPRVIVATSTLGQGVNIGISSVIVAQTIIGQNKWITKRDFWNICGRAGRAFVDGEGKILFAIDASKTPANVRKQEARAKEYLNPENLEEVKSGLLQVIRLILKISEKVGISFEVLIELIANGEFTGFGMDTDRVKKLVDLIDDQLLALHLTHQVFPFDGESIDWVEKAFQGALSAIQESEREDLQDGTVLSLLKARVTGVLKEVPDIPARHAIVASGLPLSVGKAAFRDLEEFRGIIDAYLAEDKACAFLNDLVLQFEDWARINANAICDTIPKQEILDEIRPRWLGGTPLYEISEKCGKDSLKICTSFYGYELSWLFHAVAQKLDGEVEEQRVEALSLISSLLELGLPNESSSKVFLAGVRSRAAAIELGKYISDASRSIASIRRALLHSENIGKLKPVLSSEAAEWLDLLARDQMRLKREKPTFPDFVLDAPGNVVTLHSRRLPNDDTAYLCSTDGRFIFKAQSTDHFPFHSIANDPGFVFVKKANSWSLRSRDPRLRR